MTFKLVLNEAATYSERAITFPELEKISENYKFSGVSGIYLIIKNKKVVYIGESNNLRKRLKQHLNVSTDTGKSALRRKIVKLLSLKPEETREWLEKCSISHTIIEDKQMRKLVERLLIAYYKDKGEARLND